MAKSKGGGSSNGGTNWGQFEDPAGNWVQKVVEIDESCCFWGVERDTGKCFMKEVPNRTKPPLEREIVRHILSGSHIVSDGWASYEDIPILQGGIYTHDVVIHEENFVDPNDPEVHIQTVESL